MTCFRGLTCVLLLVLVFGCAILPPVFSEDDTICLQGVKAAVANPSTLNSWNFSDNTNWDILNKFVGVSFWNDFEIRPIGLNLSDMSLGGRIPSALQYCYSLQKLDLSERRIVGLKKRIQDLRSELELANAELEDAKRLKEKAEQEIKGYEV